MQALCRQVNEVTCQLVGRPTPIAAQVTPDGAWLAFTADTRGNEAFTVYIQKVATGARSAITLPNVPAASNIVWAADNRTLLFLTQVCARPATGRHWQ